MELELMIELMSRNSIKQSVNLRADKIDFFLGEYSFANTLDHYIVVVPRIKKNIRFVR